MDFAKLLEVLTENKDDADVMAGKVRVNLGEMSFDLKLAQDLENGQLVFIAEQVPE